MIVVVVVDDDGSRFVADKMEDRFVDAFEKDRKAVVE